MFYNKAVEIDGLKDKVGRLSRELDYVTHDKNYFRSKTQDQDSQIKELVERLAIASPATFSVFDSWLAYPSFTTTFEPTPKPPEPRDLSPLGDLRRYVEMKESEKKVGDSKAAEAAKQAEIRRLADEEVAKHVAKLHKTKKKVGK